MKKLSTPVVILIYHRPDHVRQLMQALEAVHPEVIWIIADGPKDKVDRSLVEQTRNTVESAITWPCQIYPIYAKQNLGLKNRVISGLNQVFAVEEQAIILEEDCLPSPSFFHYCNDLLERYENEPKVMSISGGNYLFDQGNPINGSYYFSQYFSAWGWATWRRAWQLYDQNLSFVRESEGDRGIKLLTSNLLNPLSRYYWQTMARKIISGRVNDTWDYQWTLTHLYFGGVSIIPARNLVKNIGFGQGASHTKFRHKLQTLKTNELKFPLKHPKAIVTRHDLDRILEKLVYLNWRSILGLLLR